MEKEHELGEKLQLPQQKICTSLSRFFHAVYSVFSSLLVINACSKQNENTIENEEYNILKRWSNKATITFYYKVNSYYSLFKIRGTFRVPKSNHWVKTVIFQQKVSQSLEKSMCKGFEK